MENTSLELYHGHVGDCRSPLSIAFPESDPTEIVLLWKIARSGKGWEFAAMEATGKGK